MSDSKSNPAAQNAAAQTIDWDVVADARIYFGHQSVGRNILEGIRELSSSGVGRAITIVPSRPASADPRPALVEFPVGENGKPESKLADFAAALDQIETPDAAVAVFKYCYLDITAETDVEGLFARHRAAVSEMRARHPKLTFVHVTAPLTTLESGPRYLVKRLLGKRSTRDANANRNRFNVMLRRAFEGEPIFDLARVESTRPDGSRTGFTAANDTIYTLAPELTDDGGHLNAAGRRAAATEFAAVISRALQARDTRVPVAQR